MKFHAKTLAKTVASLLVPVLVLASPLTLAGDESNAARQPAKTENAHCAGNNANCRARATDSEVARAFISHARLDVCPDDSPDCGARAKAKRIRADDAVRDRHACRD